MGLLIIVIAPWRLYEITISENHQYSLNYWLLVAGLSAITIVGAGFLLFPHQRETTSHILIVISNILGLVITIIDRKIRSPKHG